MPTLSSKEYWWHRSVRLQKTANVFDWFVSKFSHLTFMKDYFLSFTIRNSNKKRIHFFPNCFTNSNLTLQFQIWFMNRNTQLMNHLSNFVITFFKWLYSFFMIVLPIYSITISFLIINKNDIQSLSFFIKSVGWFLLNSYEPRF